MSEYLCDYKEGYRSVIEELMVIYRQDKKEWETKFKEMLAKPEFPYPEFFDQAVQHANNMQMISRLIRICGVINDEVEIPESENQAYKTGKMNALHLIEQKIRDYEKNAPWCPENSVDYLNEVYKRLRGVVHV